MNNYVQTSYRLPAAWRIILFPQDSEQGRVLDLLEERELTFVESLPCDREVNLESSPKFHAVQEN